MNFAATAYKAAQDELASLKASRPVAELEALVAGARPMCRVVVTAGSRQTLCAPAGGSCCRAWQGETQG